MLELRWLSEGFAQILAAHCDGAIRSIYVRINRSLRIFLKVGEKSWQITAYVCEESACLVRYNYWRGYFITSQDGSPIEGKTVPHINCPQDGHLMYLTEVRPEQMNYRLWRCPECDMTRTNEEVSRASRA